MVLSCWSKRDFTTGKLSPEIKEGYYIMINRSIKSEVITEIYTHSTRAHQANIDIRMEKFTAIQ